MGRNSQENIDEYLVPFTSRTTSRHLIASAAITLSSVLTIAHAQSTATMSTEQYRAEKSRIEGEHKSAKSQCDSMKGNGKDVCVKEAKATREVAMAELEQRNQPTPRHAENVAKVKAESSCGNPRRSPMTSPATTRTSA